MGNQAGVGGGRPRSPFRVSLLVAAESSGKGRGLDRMRRTWKDPGRCSSLPLQKCAALQAREGKFKAPQPLPSLSLSRSLSSFLKTSGRQPSQGYQSPGLAPRFRARGHKCFSASISARRLVLSGTSAACRAWIPDCGHRLIPFCPWA